MTLADEIEETLAENARADYRAAIKRRWHDPHMAYAAVICTDSDIEHAIAFAAATPGAGEWWHFLPPNPHVERHMRRLGLSV